MLASCYDVQSRASSLPVCFVDRACLRWVREVTELLVCTKATDRAETCEVLEERLHEFETEVKELRADSRWDFQVRCDLTYTLGLSGLLILSTLTAWNLSTCSH